MSACADSLPFSDITAASTVAIPADAVAADGAPLATAAAGAVVPAAAVAAVPLSSGTHNALNQIKNHTVTLKTQMQLQNIKHVLDVHSCK
jgi:hypothetical protein